MQIKAGEVLNWTLDTIVEEVNRSRLLSFMPPLTDSMTVPGPMRQVTKGEDVGLTGFGSFKRIQREAREGRNPSTGETLSMHQKAAWARNTITANRSISVPDLSR